MGIHKFRKGLDLPIQGSPRQTIEEAPVGESVAVIATDYVGLKARMEVQVGDTVKRGQLLLEDRKNPGVLFTAERSHSHQRIQLYEFRGIFYEFPIWYYWATRD